jgi:hypothetical protein
MATVLFFACGLFTKQSAITLPVLVVAYDALCRPGDRLTRRALTSDYALYAALFLLLVGYLALRYVLFGNAVREDMLTLGRLKGFVFRQLFYFRNLLPIASNASFATKAGVSALTIGALIASGWRLAFQSAEYRQPVRRVIFFGAIWYAITIAPMVVTYPSSRHLYVTAAGVSIALASLILPERLNGAIPAQRARFAAAALIALLYGMALSRNVGIWIEAGIESRKYQAVLTRLLQSVPRGNTVLIDIPPKRHGAWFWSWGLPFALQTPFLSEDLYDRFAIIERPDVFCCANEWWTIKQMTLSSLWNSPGSREITVIFPAPDDAEGLQISTRSVNGPALRLKIERAIGRSVESLSSHITDAETQRVAELVLE